MASSPTVYSLPRDLWHCALENYDFSSFPRLKASVDTFCTDLVEGKAPHLLILGPPGIGKSHISVGLYRYAVAHSGTGTSIWKDVVALCYAVKSRIGMKNAPDPMVAFEQARYFVALDDLFGRKLSSWEVDNVVYWALHQVQMNRSALVATSNYSLEQIRTMLSPHEFDRLLSRATVLELKGKSWRHKGVSV